MKNRLDLDCWQSNDGKFNVVFHGSVTNANSPDELAEYVKEQILKMF